MSDIRQYSTFKFNQLIIDFKLYPVTLTFRKIQHPLVYVFYIKQSTGVNFQHTKGICDASYLTFRVYS